MAEKSTAQTEPVDAEILSSDPEDDVESTTGLPACSRCSKPTMVWTKDGGCCPACWGPAELGTEGAAASGGRSKAQAKSRRSSQKERMDELAERLGQVHRLLGQTKVEVRAAAALLEEATKCEEAEEGTQKWQVRAAKTRLTALVTAYLEITENLLREATDLAMAHLEIAENLLHEDKARSQAAVGRPSRSD